MQKWWVQNEYKGVPIYAWWISLKKRSTGTGIKYSNIYFGKAFLKSRNMLTLTVNRHIMFWGKNNTDWSTLIYTQFSSVAQSCLTLCNPMDYSTPGFPVHHQLPEPTQTHVHRVGDAIQLSYPLLSCLLVLPSIRVFSNESVLCIRRPKYWSFSFRIIPSNEYSGLISFRIDWLGLIAVQEDSQESSPTTQFKTSILRCSTFFIVLLSHPYMTTGKMIALTRQTLVCKVMSLVFNILSRLAIAFLTRSKRPLIPWLQSPPAVILEPPQNKISHCFIISPAICNKVTQSDAIILAFCMLSFKLAFSLSSFTFIKRLFSSSLSAIRVVSSACLRLLIFPLAILMLFCALPCSFNLWI